MGDLVIIRPSAAPPRVCGAVCTTLTNNFMWVFGGDSITNSHQWTVDVEAALHLRFPTHTMSFRGEGRGGGTLDEFMDGRYDCRVFSWAPNYVTVMFGQNGSPSNAEFLASLTTLTDTYIIAKNAALPIYIGPQPTHSSTGKPSLGGYSDQMVALGTTRGYPFAEVWHALQPIFAANVADGTPVDLGYDGDTIHPGPAGDLTISYTALSQMQFPGAVSAVVINATGPTLVSAHSARVTGLTANAFSGVDFVRKDSRLPMAIDDAAVVALDLMPQIANLNLYLLTVTGLSSGTYNVYCNGVLMDTTTHTELAAGWNMWPLSAGPIYDRLLEIRGLIRDKEGVSRTHPFTRTGPPFTGVHKYKSNADALYDDGDGLTGTALKAALASVIAEVAAMDIPIRAAAQPVSYTFSLRKQ